MIKVMMEISKIPTDIKSLIDTELKIKLILLACCLFEMILKELMS